MHELIEGFVQLQGKHPEPCRPFQPTARLSEGWGCLNSCPAVAALTGADPE